MSNVVISEATTPIPASLISQFCAISRKDEPVSDCFSQHEPLSFKTESVPLRIEEESSNGASSQTWGRLMLWGVERKTYDIVKETIVIGRDKDCDVVLRDTGCYVSKKHCMIKKCSDDLNCARIEALGINGVFLEQNGQFQKLIEPKFIVSGTRFCILDPKFEGSFTFSFHSAIQAKLTQTHESFDKKYTLLHEIGKGAHATVFRCISKTNINKEYAAKRLKMNEQVKSEIEMQKLFDHPNIVKIHEVIYEERSLLAFLVLDYCPSGTLQSFVVNSKESIPNYVIKSFFQQISTAVSIIHSQLIVHNDIKPQNILLSLIPNSNEFNVKLSDFGSAFHTSEEPKLIAITPRFSAPEVYLLYSEKEVSLRNEKFKTLDFFAADVWSVGAVLFFLITKKQYNTNIKLGDSYVCWNEILNKMLSNDHTQRPKIDQVCQSIQFIPIPLHSVQNQMQDRIVSVKHFKESNRKTTIITEITRTVTPSYLLTKRTPEKQSQGLQNSYQTPQKLISQRELKEPPKFNVVKRSASHFDIEYDRKKAKIDENK